MSDYLESLESSFLGVLVALDPENYNPPKDSVTREQLFGIWKVGKDFGYRKLAEAKESGLIKEHRVLRRTPAGPRWTNYYTVEHVSVD